MVFSGEPEKGAGTTVMDITRPVVITGMHRSGTSMVARLLQSSGLWLGSDDELLGGASDNPEGFYEHLRVIDLNDRLLGAFGGAWDCTPQWPEGWTALPQAQSHAGAAREIGQSLAANGRWGWKDPRGCLTLPFWLEVFPDLTVVLCVRNPLEVAVSLHERNGMSHARALQLWEAYLRSVLAATSSTQRLITHYDAHISEPHGERERLVAGVGLQPIGEVGLQPIGEVGLQPIGEGIVAKSRRHSRFGRQDLSAAGLSARLVRLYRELCEEACWNDDTDHRLAGRAGASSPIG